MTKLKLITISTASLLLISLIISTFIYREKYQKQQAISAAQSVEIVGLNMYVKQTQKSHNAALVAEQEKNSVLFASQSRIEELEGLLSSNHCARERLPNSVNKRLRDRANGFYSSTDSR